MAAATLVRDLMRPPVLVPEGMWFREMVRLLRDEAAGCLAVVDAGGRLAGIVTDEDLLLKLLRPWLEARPAAGESPARRAERGKAAGLRARDVMSEPVVTVPATQPALEAGRLMREREVRHLVVLDADGAPLGVVERSDLLAVLLRPDEEVRQDVEDLLARRLRGRADAVTVAVQDGVVVLDRGPDPELPPDGVLADVERVEGVVAVYLTGPLDGGTTGPVAPAGPALR